MVRTASCYRISGSAACGPLGKTKKAPQTIKAAAIRCLIAFVANGNSNKLLLTIRPTKAGGLGRQGNVAGTENGLVASTTNMMRAVRSVVPSLNTSIGIPALWPFMLWPDST